MKNGNADGPDEATVESWKCQGERTEEFLIQLFNMNSESEKMPEE